MLLLAAIAFFQAATAEVPAAAPAPAATTEQSAPAAPTTSATPAQAAAQVAPPRQHCRREIITGTRLTQRVCTTPRQDREMATEGRDQLQRFQTQMPLRSN